MKFSLPQKKVFLHSSNIPVNWGDMDALGHVNNTMYFRYMEIARVNWLNSLGIKLGKNKAVLNSEQELTESKPIIKIRITNDDKDMSTRFLPKEEDIIEDAASIYLLKNEEIKWKFYCW